MELLVHSLIKNVYLQRKKVNVTDNHTEWNIRYLHMELPYSASIMQREHQKLKRKQ